MNQRELLEYISSERAKSSSDEQITSHLAGVGYHPTDIEKALRAYDKDPLFGAHPRKQQLSQPFRLFLAFLAVVTAILAVYGTLVDMGIANMPEQLVPYTAPFGVAGPTTP